MTQDDWVGKYRIWKEQLKVAIITVDIAVLCAQTLVDVINYVSKISLQVSSHSSASDTFGPTPWPIERSMSGPPTRAKISDKMPGNKQILESSVELNWHYTDLNLTIVVLLFLEFQYPDSRVVWWRWSFGGFVFNFSIQEDFMTHL